MSAKTTVQGLGPLDLKDVHPTREGWLIAAAAELWPMVEGAGGTRPEKVRYSCSWPSRSALRRANAASRRIGECWHASASEDGTREIQVSPALAHPVEVMDVLLHEMIHASLPEDAGHGPAFARIMKAVGLTGKPTATVAGEALVERLRDVAERVGRYPHAKLDATRTKKQTTRMMKVECPDCGFLFRTSRAWIDTYLPVCGCGAQMVSVDYEPEGEPLDLLEAVASYTTNDQRFTLSTSKHGRREGRWIVRENFRPIDPETGELGEADYESIPSSRWTYRLNRTDALAFIAAVREGLTDFPEVHDHEDDVQLEDDHDDVGDWSASDDDLFLADDEDEVHDYPEDELTEDEVEEYELTATRRDDSGSAKSRQIIMAGGEGAMD